jgi:hypothetical protein
MAIELHHLHPSHDDELSRLKARTAELKALNHDLCERVTENDDIRLHWEEIEQTRAENERMKARIAELEEERRWRKCSEELPEDGAEVLATDGEEIWLCYKTTMSDDSPWFQPDGLPHIEGVTHWMPLPSAPKEQA